MCHMRVDPHGHVPVGIMKQTKEARIMDNVNLETDFARITVESKGKHT